MFSGPKGKLTAWAPLTVPIFRTVWLANLGSNIGSWMQEIASAWLMTSLTSSPILIALLQTVTFLPIFIVGIPAGALADIWGRKPLLMLAEIWMLFSALALGIITLLGLATPWAILVLTLCLSIGSAVSVPAFAALLQELVPSEYVETTVAIQSTGRHVARGIGSALGGLLTGLVGPGPVFLLNSSSYLIVWFTFFRWQNGVLPVNNRRIDLLSALRSGFAYVRRSHDIRTILIRTSLFGLPASAFWALLPLIGRQQLALNAMQYGCLLSSFGIGSLLGAIALPWSRHHFSLQSCSIIGSIIFSLTLIAIALSKEFLLSCIFMLIAGAAWISVVSVLNFCIQRNSDVDMRASSLAYFVVVWQGSLAVGSCFSGLWASAFGLQNSFFAASVLIFMSLPCAFLNKLDIAK